MPTPVTIHYLEMTDPGQLQPKARPRDDCVVLWAELPSPELNRYLYTAVGAGWYWIDRLSWTYRRWLDYLDRPELQTWVMYVAGTPAGYFELEAQAGRDVEVAYFGLVPRFVGMGLGGFALSEAIRRGWEMNAARVWLHTCSLDHPAALPNYLARGLRVYRTEVVEKELPPESPGPWPGAEVSP